MNHQTSQTIMPIPARTANRGGPSRAGGHPWRLLLTAALVLGSTWTAWSPSVASGTVISVNTTDDEINRDGDCSLREAVIAANDDDAVDACPTGNGADTILLPSGTYSLTRIGSGENASQTGDLDITSDLTIRGAGPTLTEIDGNGSDRVLSVLSGTTTLARLSIAHGDAGIANGGGVRVAGALVLQNCRVHENLAEFGGGIFVAAGTLTVVSSRIDRNGARDAGGGIMNAGIASTTHVVDSEISLNLANHGGGGGIFNGGSATLSNSTVSTNLAGNHGGGILTLGGGPHGGPRVWLFNVTVAENFADRDNDGVGNGGGLYTEADGVVNARNSLIGNNHDVGPGTVHHDCSGRLDGVGYNLIEDPTGCTLGGSQAGYVVGVDPDIDSLQDNGGSTSTHALRSGSPAIDGGIPSGCVGPNGIDLDVDQRGFSRNGRCDIGAFEYDSPGTPTPSPTNIPTKTPTFTRTLRPSATPTRTATRTSTATRSVTPSNTATRTVTRTATITTTAPPTYTATPPVAATATATQASTASASPTSVATETFSPSATSTPEPSPTATAPATQTSTMAIDPSGPSPTASPTATTIATFAAAVCQGDCNGDAAVRIDELVRGVNIALNALPVSACAAMDASGDDAVRVDELITAVNAALRGCPPLSMDS